MKRAAWPGYLRSAVAPVMMIMMIAATGCTGGGTVTSARTAEGWSPAPTTPWPFAPTRLRLHPLSRIVESEDGLILEVRVELRDRDGDTAKGVGDLRVELVRARAGVIATWERDLNNLKLNQLHYDDVTRTYLLRLEVTPTQVEPGGTLRASLEAPHGVTLRDEIDVPARRN